VFRSGPAGDNDVIQIGENEIKATEYPVHSPLKGVAGVAKAKGHAEELEEAERSNYRRLLNVVFIHQDLVVALP
jgi:hypothetical protein